MLPAGASDADREIVPALGSESGDPFAEERLDIGHHFEDLRLALQIVDHRLILPGERAKRRIVVGVREVPDIENEVRCDGDSFFEREGFKGNCHFRGRSIDKLPDPGFQHGRREI